MKAMMDKMEGCLIRLLGTFTLNIGNGTMHFPTQKAIELFAFLPARVEKSPHPKERPHPIDAALRLINYCVLSRSRVQF